jgi:Uma2 family endonuclease
MYTHNELYLLSQMSIHSDNRFELIDGRLCVLPLNGWKHGAVNSRLQRFLRDHVYRHQLGMTTAAGTGYILSDAAEHTVRAPDVGFIAKHRLPETLPESGYVPFAPDLAIEVISPNDDPEEVHRKVAQYLKYGTQLVWLFYPNAQTVGIYNGKGFQSLEREDTLDGGDVLPGFRLPLTEVFKD